MNNGAWLNQSVNRLVRQGHSLNDIGNYTLDQFLMFLEAASELEADQRMSFVTDMTVVVGSLFSKDAPVAEHMNLLADTVSGVKSGNEAS